MYVKDGVFLGDSLVTCINDKVYVRVINTTESEFELLVPTVQLQEVSQIATNCKEIVHLGNNNIISTNSLDAKSTISQSSRLSDVPNSTPYLISTISESAMFLSSPVLGQEKFLGKHCNFNDSNSSISLPSTIPESVNSSNEPNRIFHSFTESESRADQVIKMLRLDHLNHEEKENVLSLVKRHQDRFHLPEDTLGKTAFTFHKIPTIDDVPINTKQYRFPPIHKAEINKQVSQLLSSDIIRPSTSPYNSPVWIVPKKADSKGNKRWRMVIDYRNLNEKTIGDAYPLPNINDILDQLGAAKYFSVLDLASGFHQIPMDPSHAHKTAFSTPHGHYEFTRMPFGLKNAPATFQRLMDQVLCGLQGTELFVYIDDIVVYASSLHEHDIKIQKLMDHLRNAKLLLQPDKCEFLRHEVTYLGHIIGSEGVRPNPEKTAAVKNFPIPRTAKNVKQFLGLAGYYRRFIPNFSGLTKPLTNLLKKNVPFVWKTEQQEAFEHLKTLLCEQPILQYPDFSKPFILTTDASNTAIGGVLSQGTIGQDLPIAYVSRVLNSAETNYSTIEKELLAIIYCTHHFRPYLYGHKFFLVTDHQPLVWLYKVKDPTSRLMRWRLKLDEYNYEIIYKSGSVNHNADALSRNPQILAITDSPHPLSIEIIEISSEEDLNLPSLTSSQFESVDEQSEDESQILPPYLNGQKILEIEENIPSIASTSTNVPETQFPPIDNNDNTDEQITESESSDEEDDEEMYQHLTQARIKTIRDQLSIRKDNLVILVTQNGHPVDTGAKELHQLNKIPPLIDLTLGRAHVEPYSVSNKNLIILSIKERQTIITDWNILQEAIRSLLDVTTELQLTSFSIAKTPQLDDIPWPLIAEELQNVFDHRPISITICEGLTVIPPEEERSHIIEECHQSTTAGHKGVTKTFHRIRQNYYWNNIKAQVQEFIRNCRECQLKKLVRLKTRQPMVLTDTPGFAFDKIAMDVMGPLPKTKHDNKYILTIQDLLTKYSIAVPMENTSAITTAEAFVNNFICRFGCPKAILTDQGTNFLSYLMKNIAKRFKIKHFRTSTYHPQSNGSVERSHHVFIEYLKVFISKNEEWDEFMERATFSYNTSVHEGTKYTPHELIFGRIARIPSSRQPIAEEAGTYQHYLLELFNQIREAQETAKTNLEQAKIRSKRYYDRRLNEINFQVGDYVFLKVEKKTNKFTDEYSGPHKILEILNHENIRIQFKNTTKLVHANKLRLSHITEPG